MVKEVEACKVKGRGEDRVEVQNLILVMVSKNINIGRQFVTAKLLGTKDIIRQGVKVFEDEESIIVVGIDATYKCDKSYVFVPYRELSGEAKRLADGMGVTR